MRTALKTPLLVWLILLVVWFIYRYIFRFSEEIDELFVKPVIWLGLILYVVRVVEKRSLSTIGWIRDNLFANLYLGWGLGAFFAFEGIITNAIKYRGLVFFPVGITIFDLGKMVLLSLATGFTEETVFRGYLFTRLKEAFNDELIANLMSAFLFALIHIPIAIFIVGYSPLELLGYEAIIFALGIANGFIFNKTKSIVAPTVSHGLWNMTVMMFR